MALAGGAHFSWSLSLAQCVNFLLRICLAKRFQRKGASHISSMKRTVRSSSATLKQVVRDSNFVNTCLKLVTLATSSGIKTGLNQKLGAKQGADSSARARTLLAHCSCSTHCAPKLSQKVDSVLIVECRAACRWFRRGFAGGFAPTGPSRRCDTLAVLALAMISPRASRMR
jgi:hypothetical protein